MEEAEYKLMRKLESKHWWFVARRKIIASMISKLDLPEGAQILEVGCGSGGNLEMLAKSGDVYAVEMNEDARKNAKDKLIAKEIEYAKLPAEMPFAEKKFDLIVMLDVIEHIDEVSETLKVLHKRLQGDGILFITAPAFQFLWSEHDVSCHHKQRYDARSVKAVLNEAGYKDHYVSYFNFWLFPIVYIFRKLKNIFGKTEAASDTKMPGRFVNAVMTQIFGSERFLLGNIRLPFGVSLMATAKKAY